MSEKMLVTQALDERDLLVKKIGDKIEKIKMVDTKKRNEEKTADSRVTPEEFGSTAASAYQQIMDLIDRFQRIDAAIVASNGSSAAKSTCTRSNKSRNSAVSANSEIFARHSASVFCRIGDSAESSSSNFTSCACMISAASSKFTRFNICAKPTIKSENAPAD